MKRRRKSFWDFLELFAGGAALVGSIALLLLVLLTAYIVVMRYVLKNPQGWAFETSLFLQVGLIFLGAAYTLLEEAHVRVDVLFVRLPEKARLIINIITMSMIFIFSAVLMLRGIPEALFYWGRYTVSAAMLPLFPVYAVIPVGAFLLCMACISRIRSYLLLLMKSKGGG